MTDPTAKLTRLVTMIPVNRLIDGVGLYTEFAYLGSRSTGFLFPALVGEIAGGLQLFVFAGVCSLLIRICIGPLFDLLNPQSRVLPISLFHLQALANNTLPVCYIFLIDMASFTGLSQKELGRSSQFGLFSGNYFHAVHAGPPFVCWANSCNAAEISLSTFAAA